VAKFRFKPSHLDQKYGSTPKARFHRMFLSSKPVYSRITGIKGGPYGSRVSHPGASERPGRVGAEVPGPARLWVLNFTRSSCCTLWGAVTMKTGTILTSKQYY